MINIFIFLCLLPYCSNPTMINKHTCLEFQPDFLKQGHVSLAYLCCPNLLLEGSYGVCELNLCVHLKSLPGN